MPDRATIDRFLALDRVAVVGASRDSRQFANSIYRTLRDGTRTVVPIHPLADSIEGDAASPSLAEARSVQGVVIMLPKASVASVVDEAIALGIRHIWLHAGIGSSSVTDDAVERCREAGVEVVDGACPLMFIEPVRGIHRVHRALSRRVA
jgi:predicted CoA-binding protein